MYIVSRYEYFGDGKIWETYMEIIDKYVARQVLVCGDETIGSNRKDDILGFFLIDSEIDIEEIEGIDIVKKAKFEKVWNKHIDKFLDTWQDEKNSFSLGAKVNGVVKAVYPQGVVVECSGSIGFCLRGEKEYFIGEEAEFKVEGLDDENLWVVLKDI